MSAGSKADAVSDDEQPRRRLRWLLPFVATVAAVGVGGLVLAAWIARVEVRQLVDATEWRERSTAALGELEGLLRAMVDAETATRGYALTGDPSYLDPHRAAIRDAPRRLAAIEELLPQAAAAQTFTEVRRLVGRVFETRAELVAARDQRGLEGAVAWVASRRGRTVAEELRAAVARLAAEERARLSTREAEVARSTDQLDRTLLATAIGSIVAIAGSAAARLGEMRRRRAAQALERRAAGELRVANAALGEANRALEAAVAGATRANAELLASNTELEAFAYSVSHDLRAPLRSIDGFSRALIEDVGDALAPEHRDHLGRVRAAARRMGALIDDLLALSRVTRQPLRIEDVDLDAMAKSVCDEIRAETPDRDVALTLGPLPRVRGDPRLLRIALTNLLSNAWKYTAPRATAHVDVTGSAAEGQGEVVVGDDGVGFDPTYAHKLFGVFQRLHGDHEFEGTGIGLATVRRIVTRHGGRVWAEGRPGKGARFHMVLPLAERETEEVR
jgi:signal transduction histidine kinase